jgi:hypothetical protein
VCSWRAPDLLFAWPGERLLGWMSVVNIADYRHESEDHCAHNRQKNEDKDKPPETDDGNRANDCPGELCTVHMHREHLPFLLT